MLQPPNSTREDFDQWLAQMPAALEYFLHTLPPGLQEKLDYSPDSLDVLEAWLLRNYPTTKSMYATTEAQKVGGAARYIGETIRRTVGGRWDIRLDDPEFVYFGMPILIGLAGNSTPLCPLTLATATADRRTGTFLRTILQNEKTRLNTTR